MDLKRVNRISQKHKDIVFGYIKQVQSLLPPDNAFFNIVSLIQHLILLYYSLTFASKILNEDEREKFLNLLQANDKIIVDYPWKLIFDSEEDGLGFDSFTSKVHGHRNVLLLIELNGECVIGGYTKIGWTKGINTFTWKEDNDAFVYYLKSPKNYKPFISSIDVNAGYSSKVIGHYPPSWKSYACIGYTFLFYIQECKFHQQANYSRNAIETFKHGESLLTASHDYNGTEYIVIEVFQIEM